jgi:predicted nucleic acid-binding protein
MAEQTEYILDATVLTKWHLADEAHRQEALRVREDHVHDRIHLVVPDLIFHEVTNALLKATRNPQRKVRPTYEQALREVDRLHFWGLTSIPSSLMTTGAYRVANRYGCSYYDGVYLALAEITGARFIHADSKLRTNLGNRFPLALWIEDYQPQ